MVFSTKEKKELFIATLLFISVEITVVYPLVFIILFSMESKVDQIALLISRIIILGVLTAPLFLLHELGHRQMARRLGLVSEFRLDPQMSLLSLLSIALPIKIIAPGAVVSYDSYPSHEKSGRISMAGPLINLILAGIFLIISFLLFPIEEISLIMLHVSRFSLDLALFNLLPFSILDGKKILTWNPSLYYVLMAITISAWLLHPVGILNIFL